MRHTIVALVVTVGAASATCDRATVPKSQPVPAVTAFNARVAADGEVAFLSWNGKWIGTDSDIAIVFRPKGAAEMTSYNYAVQQYKGTYRVADDGGIMARFDELRWPWPVLVLEQDGGSFVLRPKDSAEYHGERWTFRSRRTGDAPREK